MYCSIEEAWGNYNQHTFAKTRENFNNNIVNEIIDVVDNNLFKLLRDGNLDKKNSFYYRRIIDYLSDAKIFNSNINYVD